MSTIAEIAEGDEKTREAAYDYLRAVGIAEPTPDAIGQLAGPFTHALAIMCTRGYDREGKTWRQLGWRGLVDNILDKIDRLHYHSWLHRDFDGDSALDAINFCGMYWRLGNKGPAWGKRGEPG